MGESHDERMARKKRERAAFKKMEDEAYERLAEAADKDPEVARKLDEMNQREFNEVFQSTFGMNESELEIALDKELLKGQGVTDRDVEEARAVIRKAAKQARGGWFSRGSAKKAKQTLGSSKAVKKVAAAAKRKKGCVVVGIGLMGLGVAMVGSAVWGAVEVVSALVR